jgi:hypothetical protein
MRGRGGSRGWKGVAARRARTGASAAALLLAFLAGSAAGAGAVIALRMPRTAGAFAAFAGRPETSPPPLGAVDSGRPSAWHASATALEGALQQEFGSRTFAFHRDPPYLLALERTPGFDDGRAETYQRVLRDLHTRFLTEFGSVARMPQEDAVLPVLVLADRDSYRRYCERVHGRPLAPMITGLYEVSRRRIVMYHSPLSGPEVLRHEGVHQLWHAIAGTDAPMDASWFHEGLAALFEFPPASPSGPPAASAPRLAVARAAADSFPLDALVAMRAQDVWNLVADGRNGGEIARRAQEAYALAAAWIHFLQVRHRRVLLEYMRAELSGTGGPQILRSIWERESGRPWEEAQEAFRVFLRAP